MPIDCLSPAPVKREVSTVRGTWYVNPDITLSKERERPQRIERARIKVGRSVISRYLPIYRTYLRATIITKGEKSSPALRGTQNRGHGNFFRISPVRYWGYQLSIVRVGTRTQSNLSQYPGRCHSGAPKSDDVVCRNEERQDQGLCRELTSIEPPTLSFCLSLKRRFVSPPSLWVGTVRVRKASLVRTGTGNTG